MSLLHLLKGRTKLCPSDSNTKTNLLSPEGGGRGRSLSWAHHFSWLMARDGASITDTNPWLQSPNLADLCNRYSLWDKAGAILGLTLLM